ncbi:MAG: UDP-4-amino-4,6-dideoxy-N-acetyl-beta-L-altrosamine N-acetyltransferase, partial [Gammaproteobacteria bacterium]
AFRVVEETDLEQVRALRNDPSTWVHLTDPHLITREAQRQWFAGLANRPDRMYLVICDEQQPFIGIVRMDEYDRLHRSIRVGADVAPELRGQGYGKKTFQALKKYCFDMLNLHRIWLAVLETNERAIRLYLSQGFQMEGRFRRAIFRDGKYVDYLLMSLLEEEYRHDSAV